MCKNITVWYLLYIHKADHAPKVSDILQAATVVLLHLDWNVVADEVDTGTNAENEISKLRLTYWMTALFCSHDALS